MNMSSFSGAIGHLGRLDLEVRVAAVHVVGAQLLQIARSAIRANSDRPACTRTASSAYAARARARTSFSLNLVLPTRLIMLILARLPSLMSTTMSTLLPGNSVILVSTRTAYLPRLKYWSVRYCLTSSSTERSKVLPVARPTLRRLFCRSSVLMSLLPLISNFAIEGRSTTTTSSVLPSRRSSTSRKKPVAYSARIASPMRCPSR